MTAMILALAFAAAGAQDPKRDPAVEARAQELLSVDRNFAATAAKTNVIDALASMFAADVVMPSPPGVFAKSRDEALTMLRNNPDNAQGHLEWTPVRVGISADGVHGFTYGYMTMTRADASQLAMKYLAYWVKGADGWRVAAYKRAGRPAGDVSMTLTAPSLPPRVVAPNTDAAVVARLAQELGNAERAFSLLAGKIGLGPAFEHNGAPDAMNMGGAQSAAFVIGPDAISRNVGGTDSTPSKLTWGPDEKVIVASSGDLGVTIGYISAPDPQGGAVRKIPFFTIWKRTSPTSPWQYVAE